MLCFVSSWIKLAQCETYGGGGAYLFISALAVYVYVGVCPRSRPTVSDDNGCQWSEGGDAEKGWGALNQPVLCKLVLVRYET